MIFNLHYARFKVIFLLIFFISEGIFSQTTNLSPIPSLFGTEFFYKPVKDFTVSSASLAGTFNHWNKSSHKMNFDPKKGLWSIVVDLVPGVEYQYKYVINDTLWVTDPNAPSVTEDEWRNGIIIPIPYGAPFVVSSFPSNGKRITSLDTFYFVLQGVDTSIDKNSIEVFLDENKIQFDFEYSSNKISFIPRNDLSEGEHSILIRFSDLNGNRNKGHLTKFFLDRFKAEINTPEFYNSAVMYEIYIRKFFDSDQDGFGDFNGVRAKLDYLQELGISTIWLMPFNESSKEHGYNVVDYFSIEQDYGTFEDYFHFLKECKLRGIRVIMDLAINHCDTLHQFFMDAVRNSKSKYSSWFQFTDSSNSNWRHFGIEKGMPKFNFENDAVQDYFIDVIKYWVDPNADGDFTDGVDGIRFDAAKEVPHKFWNRVRKEIKSIEGGRKDFLLLGEIWDGANYLIPFFEDEFDMCFDYPIFYALERFFKNGDNKTIESILEQEKQIYPANFQMVRFLSNHDNDRMLSFFDSDTSKLYQALTIIFTLPGTPMIYYGDEIGMTGKTPPENVRHWMDWNKLNEGKNPIYDFLSKLISVRKSFKTFHTANDEKITSVRFLKTNYPEVLSYLRFDTDEQFLIVINNSDNQIDNVRIDDNDFSQKHFAEVILSKYPINNKINSSTILLKNLILLPRDFMVLKIK